MPDATPRLSPLHDVHVAAGAAFTEFAGWSMPVRYSGDLAEHHAVRRAAGLFDLSHMAEILVLGPGRRGGARRRPARRAVEDAGRPREVHAAPERRGRGRGRPRRLPDGRGPLPRRRERREPGGRRRPPPRPGRRVRRPGPGRDGRHRPDRDPGPALAGDPAGGARLRRRRRGSDGGALPRAPDLAPQLPIPPREAGTGTPCSSPAPATPARTASSSTRRPRCCPGSGRS